MTHKIWIIFLSFKPQSQTCYIYLTFGIVPSVDFDFFKNRSQENMSKPYVIMGCHHKVQHANNLWNSHFLLAHRFDVSDECWRRSILITVKDVGGRRTTRASHQERSYNHNVTNISVSTTSPCKIWHCVWKLYEKTLIYYPKTDGSRCHSDTVTDTHVRLNTFLFGKSINR